MGRVLIEGAFEGRVRIGSSLGGIPTVIEDEVDGLLFEPGNADDLARQLRRIIEDSALVERLSQTGRERAEREFTAEAYMSQYNEIIDAVSGTQVAKTR
jgi:glycosyltransferase involved in cell wall biosynthesis